MLAKRYERLLDQMDRYIAGLPSPVNKRTQRLKGIVLDRNAVARDLLTTVQEINRLAPPVDGPGNLYEQLRQGHD